jgi:hypothetical protein
MLRFRAPVYHSKDILSIGLDAEITQTLLAFKGDVKKIAFPHAGNVREYVHPPCAISTPSATNGNLLSAHLDTIAQAPAAFRNRLLAIECGDPVINSPHKIEVTDKGIIRLLKACPNLEHIQLTNCTNVTTPLKHIIKHCQKIVSIIITAKADGKPAKLGLDNDSMTGPFDDLLEQGYEGFRPGLRYMEFHNLTFNLERTVILDLLVAERKHLDIALSHPEFAVETRFFQNEEGTTLEERYHQRSDAENRRMFKALLRATRDPELERYGAYDDDDDEEEEEFGDPYDLSDSDDGDEFEIGPEEYAARGYYDDDYNPYNRNGDVDINFLRAHGYDV